MADSSSSTDMSLVNWLSSGTMTHLEGEMQRLWSWELPHYEPPPIRVAPALPVVVTPHIPMRWQKTFMRHRFKIGGSKK